MKKEPFLQVSKRRNKARWQERLLIRFIALILALIHGGSRAGTTDQESGMEQWVRIAVCGRPYEIQWYCCVFPLVWHLHLK